MASKRQRKKRAKQRRHALAAAERARKLDIQKQERSRKYQQKHADVQKAVAISQPPKKAKTTQRRDWLVNAFLQRVDDANAYLKEFEDNGTISLLNDDYGGMFVDTDIMTLKKRFRRNPSSLSNKQLEQRISLIDSFLSDAPEYRKDKERYDSITKKLGLNNNDMLSKFGDFMEFVRSMLGDRVEPSDIIKDIAVARLNNGQTLDDLKHAFMDSYLHNDSYWTMIDSFSEQGVYI